MTPSDSSGRCPGVLGDQFDDPGDLVGDGVLLADAAGPERHQDVGEAVGAGDAGEGGQRPVVQVGLGVGERDEPLILGPVVPAERPGALRRREQGAHDVEDRFHVPRPRRDRRAPRLRLPRRPRRRRRC